MAIPTRILVATSTPQAPQVMLLVPRFASQPLVATPSQLSKPAVQPATAHTPEEQAAVAFGSEQTVPQAPQFETLVCVLVSHPLVGLLSQFAKPAAHAPSVHVPPLQDSPALARSHGLPHVPQSVRVVTLRSHPLLGLPSQLA